MKRIKIFHSILWIQGIYTFVTAVWPLIDIQSFMAVTGPKTDVWLVKTVAILLIPISLCFISNIFVTGHLLPLALLALTSCAGLIFIDFYYTSHNVIRWVYAVDGILQTIFMAVWIYLILSVKKRNNMQRGELGR